MYRFLILVVFATIALDGVVLRYYGISAAPTKPTSSGAGSSSSDRHTTALIALKPIPRTTVPFNTPLGKALAHLDERLQRDEPSPGTSGSSPRRPTGSTAPSTSWTATPKPASLAELQKLRTQPGTMQQMIQAKQSHNKERQALYREKWKQNQRLLKAHPELMTDLDRARLQRNRAKKQVANQMYRAKQKELKGKDKMVEAEEEKAERRKQQKKVMNQRYREKMRNLKTSQAAPRDSAEGRDSASS